MVSLKKILNRWRKFKPLSHPFDLCVCCLRQETVLHYCIQSLKFTQDRSLKSHSRRVRVDGTSRGEKTQNRISMKPPLAASTGHLSDTFQDPQHQKPIRWREKKGNCHLCHDLCKKKHIDGAKKLKLALAPYTVDLVLTH